MATRGEGLRTLSVDFDGVLHDNRGGWQGPNLVSGGPIPGACRWLAEVTQHFRVCVFSSRSCYPGARALMRDAIMQWMLCSDEIPANMREAVTERVIRRLEWPQEKPPAHISIDDRAYRFEGKFPSVEEIEAFRPWNRRPN